MKRLDKLLTISLLILSASTMLIVRMVDANPAPSGGYPKPSQTPVVLPPGISILNPKNGTNNGSNTVTLSFTVNAPESPNPNTTDRCIWWVYYRTDWLHNIKEPFGPSEKYVCVYYKQFKNHEMIDYKEFNVTLTEVPKGNHTIEVYSTGTLTCCEGQNKFSFSRSSLESVYFIVDYPSNLISHTAYAIYSSLVVASIVIVAVASISLVYFVRRRDKL